MASFKIKIFVNHKPIGWMRKVITVGTSTSGPELVVTPSLARGTVFFGDTAGDAMADFVGPDRTTDKGPAPVLTFQLCAV